MNRTECVGLFTYDIAAAILKEGERVALCQRWRHDYKQKKIAPMYACLADGVLEHASG